jgi:hypothetical protein
MTTVGHMIGRELTTERRLADLSPEQIERVVAAKKRRAATNPSYENMTLEQFINWHPIGRMSWEERAQRMNEILREDKIILLSSSGRSGHLPGTIEISYETACWLAGFLDGTISSNKHEADEKRYEVNKISSGDVVFEEIRKGGFVSDIVFSSEEIQDVLTKLRGKIHEYSENTSVLATVK